jgi:hypothetical protein
MGLNPFMLGCIFLKQNDRIKSAPSNPAAVEDGNQNRRTPLHEGARQNSDQYFGYYSELHMK